MAYFAMSLAAYVTLGAIYLWLFYYVAYPAIKNRFRDNEKVIAALSLLAIVAWMWITVALVMSKNSIIKWILVKG